MASSGSSACWIVMVKLHELFATQSTRFALVPRTAQNFCHVAGLSFDALGRPPFNFVDGVTLCLWIEAEGRFAQHSWTLLGAVVARGLL